MNKKYRLILIALLAVAFIVMAGIPTKSQFLRKQNNNGELISGRNVNMVPFPQENPENPLELILETGDPYLQRQNEPSIAVSTRNPFHLLAGANDYRTVDIPGKPEDELPGQEVGGTAQAPREPWLGVFKSFDGGESWITTLHPGYPQDESYEGLTFKSQIYQLGLPELHAAADPVVRAGIHGLFYYAGIAFDRQTKIGIVFVSRFIDNNNKENGDCIKYLDTKIIDIGTEGQFIDKPWIAVDIPRNNRTVIIDGQEIPAFNVYIAYSVFLGDSPDNPHSKLLFVRSTDCGDFWEKPTKLSESENLNQGATIAVDFSEGSENVYVAWRRFKKRTGKKKEQDAILIAISDNNGRKFDKSIEVATLDPFDQGSSVTTFRTNSYPSITVDHEGYVYMAWAQRMGGPDEQARIVLATSNNGKNWTFLGPVEEAGAAGHQIMPSITYAAGKIILVWYDQRNDISVVGGKYIAGIDHTLDVRAAQAYPGANPQFEPSNQVSRYLFVLTGTEGNYSVQQVQNNFFNFPLFKTGEWPFMGDYLDVVPSPMFVLDDSDQWRYNTEPSDTAIFHAAWTDNRDVRRPKYGDWTLYSPPSSNLQYPFNNNTTESKPCQDWINVGMRNQNIYTARLTRGIIAGSPGNTKPVSPLGYTPDGKAIPRAFVVFVKNTTDIDRSFRLAIENQPPGGRASFFEFDELDWLDVKITPKASVSRSVFVYSSDPDATVRISVTEIWAPDGDPVPGGLISAVVLNPDIQNPDIQNPDIQNPDIQNPDIQNAEVHNPDIQNTYVNPDIMNPDIQNPDIQNPDIQNPDIMNPDIMNPDIQNPDIMNPDIQNPDIQNPDIMNPDIQNPTILDPSAGKFVDIIWDVQNTGNTTSSFVFKTLSTAADEEGNLPPGIQAQLLIYRVYTTPNEDSWIINRTKAGGSCSLGKQEHHELIVNVINPDIQNPDIQNVDLNNPDIQNPDIQNATFSLEPEGVAKVILRLWKPNSTGYGSIHTANADQPWWESIGENMIGFTSSTARNTADLEAGLTTFPDDSTAKNEAEAYIINKKYLKTGRVGEPYSDILTASGGAGGYEWLDIDMFLPTIGLSLDQYTGEVSGTPTTAGTHTFRVRVTDDSGESREKDIWITILGASDPESYTISGRVLLDGIGLAGVIMTAETQPGQTHDIVITDSVGYYSISVPENWTGTITPTLTGYTFDPASTTYTTPVESDIIGHNYTTTTAGATITGTVMYNGLSVTDDLPSGDHGAKFWGYIEPPEYNEEWIFDVNYNKQDGTFSIDNVPPYAGNYHLIVRIQPGDTYDWRPWPGTYYGYNADIVVNPGDTTVTANLDCEKYIHLTSPIDNSTSLGVWQVEPRPYIPWPSPVTFQWNSVSGANRYHYSIRKEQDMTNETIEDPNFPIEGDIYEPNTSISQALDPSAEGEHYAFRVSTFNANEKFIADLMIVYDDSYMTPYVFKVPAAPQIATISGTVSVGAGSGEGVRQMQTGVEGVIMTGFPGDPVQTDSNGDYSAEVPLGWTGDVIPVKDGYVFDPYIIRFENVDENLIDENYEMVEGVFMRYNDSSQNSDDTAQDIATDLFGNIFVAGESIRKPPPGKDWLTLKYNPSGGEVWTAPPVVPSSKDDYFVTGIEVDPWGHAVVGGIKRIEANPDHGDFKIQRYRDSDGWTMRGMELESGLHPDMKAIAVDAVGYAYWTGFRIIGSDPDNRYITESFNLETGDARSFENFDSGGDGVPAAIVVDSQGYIYRTGAVSIGGDLDFQTEKFDYQGNKIWPTPATYDSGFGNDRPHAMAVDPSGNVYVAGEVGTASNGQDYGVVKYDPDGNFVWVVNYNNDVINQHDIPWAIAVTDNGIIYVTGRSDADDIGESMYTADYATVKIVEEGGVGVIKWVAMYDGPPGGDHDVACAIAVDPHDNIYVTGRSVGSDGSIDYATIKYNDEGVNFFEWWVRRFNGGFGDDIPKALVLDAYGNVCLTGESMTEANGNDFITIKYTQRFESLHITTSSLPNGFIGSPYGAVIEAFGSTIGRNWTLNQGDQLPPGLSINGTTGFISGTPTAPGIYNFTVNVDDGNSLSDNRAFTINIGAGGSAYKQDQASDAETDTALAPCAEGSQYQSFTPSASVLTAVSLRLRVGEYFPSGGIDTTVKIRSDTWDGDVLATATTFIAGPQSENEELTVSYDVTPPLIVTSGNTYVIEWASADLGYLEWFITDGNPYTGGEAYDCQGNPISNTDFIFTTYTSPASTEPAIAVSPTSLHFEAIEGTDPLPQNLLIMNSGGGAGTLDYNLTSIDGWLTFVPDASGNLAAGATKNHEVHISALSEGQYSTTITITAAGATNSPQTVNVTIQVNPVAGVLFTKINAGGTGSSAGCAWGDFDGDGDLDLFVANQGQDNRLFRNDGSGTLTEMTNAADYPMVSGGGASTGACWGDYDNDGGLDLFVVNLSPASFLYHNDGDGTFTSLAGQDFPMTGYGGSSCAWVDYDNDGYIDLFVTNNGPNHLYHNLQGQSFGKIIAAGNPVVTDPGISDSCAWGDYNRDGLLDLFVANNDASNPNYLYKNLGSGNFERVPTSGVEEIAYSVGCAWGDFDNDLDLDLFVTNYVTSTGTNFLYRNNGGPDFTFTKITGDPSYPMADDTGQSRCASWIDYDNDADLDLFVSNEGGTANFLYQNLWEPSSPQTFVKITDGDIVENPVREHCWADYDSDGDLDLFGAHNGGQNFMFQNNGNSNQWIDIKCVGRESNRSAIGAKVQLQFWIDGLWHYWVKEIGGMHGGDAQSSLNAEFGLKVPSEPINDLRIEWPSGPTQVIPGPIDSNQYLIVEEGYALPKGVAGVLYKHTLTALEGTAPYSWFLSEYSDPLPPGLGLAEDGVISETPTSPYTVSVIVMALDSSSPVRNIIKSLNMEVRSPEDLVDVPNPSFEDGTGDWPFGWAPVDLGDKYHWGETYAHEGSKSVGIDSPESALTELIWRTNDFITVDDTKDYTLRVWYQSEAPNAEDKAGLRIFQYDQNGFLVEGTGLGIKVEAGVETSWTELIMNISASQLDPATAKIKIELFRYWEGATNPNSTIWFDDMNLEESAAAPAPIVTGINPIQGTTDQSALSAMVTGQYFGPAASVWLVYGSDSIPGQDVVVDTSGDFLNCTFNLTAVSTHFGEAWDVKVTNLDDQSHTLADAFVIYLPDPTVTGINPSSAETGSTVNDAVITGTNFVSGSSVNLEKDSQTIGTTVENVTNTQITCDFDLTGAAVGSWDIVVTVPGAENAGTQIGGFSVISAAPSPDHVVLSGPSKVGGGFLSEAFTLESQDAGGNPVNVTEDTTFSLSTDSAGIAKFYSDPEGTTEISQIMIPNGQSSATFYYMDDLAGMPIVTATRTDGMLLGYDTHQTDVWAVVGQIAYTSDRDGNDEIYIMNADGTGQMRLTINSAKDYEPCWSPDGSKIVFTSNRDGDQEIYVMNADGSWQTRLTDNVVSEFGPSWSPDGSKIAFVRMFQIYVMNADGTGESQITSGPSDSSPCWSPDGSQIAFVSTRETNIDIYVKSADGTGPETRLTTHTAQDVDPSWSPDGKIAFASARHGAYRDIYVMDADGSNQTRLTTDAAEERTPSWSPDGSKIVFEYYLDATYKIKVMYADGSSQTTLTTSSPLAEGGPNWGGSKIVFQSNRGDGDNEIYVMNADGTGQTILTYNTEEEYEPAWSPDGIKIAFRRDLSGNGEIFVMNSDGTLQTNLTNNPNFDYKPAWSPAGSKIAFSRLVGGNDEIFVMDADGLNQTNLTNHPDQDFWPSWSPDGSKIAFQRMVSGIAEIFVMSSSDGSIQINLTNNPAEDTWPSWSPDGTNIAFASDRSGNNNIYIMNTDGTNVTQLTTNPATDSRPAWSADGRKIVFESDRDGDWEIYVMNEDGTGQTNISNFNSLSQDGTPNWRPQPRLIKKYLLTIITFGTGSGSVAESVGGSPSSGPYNHGTVVTLTATPLADDSEFVKWMGDLSGSTNPTTITMDGPKTVAAKFDLKQYTISGNVMMGVEGLGGVTMDGLPGNPQTADISGFYSGTVDYGWTGTVTPQKTGWTFNPTNIPYTDPVTSDKLNQDYTVIGVPSYIISGTVTSNGSPLQDVDMGGLPGSPKTDINGDYNATVDLGWSGTVTPEKEGYSFDPVSRTYFDMHSGESGQDYTASPILTFVVQPSNSVGSQTIPPPVDVKAGPGFPDVSITLNLETNPGNGNLTGTATAITDPDGIATFSNLEIDKGGYYYTLGASATNYASGISGPFTVEGFSNTASDMSEERAYHQATRLNDGRVLITGGYDGNNILSSAQVYDPATGQFSSPIFMTIERRGHTATLLDDGRVLITGGLTPVNGESPPQVGEFTDSAEIYDPTTNSFSSTGNMVLPRKYHTATLLNSGKVLIAGGRAEGSVEDPYETTAEIYDPGVVGGGTFSLTTGEMTWPRRNHTATLLPNGTVFIAGGHFFVWMQFGPGDPVPIGWAVTTYTDIYDPSTDSFSFAGGMNKDRTFHTATLLNDGTVLIAGGDSCDSDVNIPFYPLDSFEIYNPGDSTFSGTYSMIDTHSGHTATKLVDGKVLIVGADSAEIYDPSIGIPSNRFRATGLMGEMRKYHTATQLRDGTVLVTGGEGEGATDTAEIFYPTTAVLYGVNSGDDGLSIIDPVSGEVTFIGKLDTDPNKLVSPIAMAIRPTDGKIFVWDNTSGEDGLYTVDPCSGLATEVDPSTPDQLALRAIAFAPGGKLYGFYSDLYEIDTTTGVLTLIGGNGVGGADFDANGVLYGLTYIAASDEMRLVTVDTTTGNYITNVLCGTALGYPQSIVFDPSGTLIGSAMSHPTLGNVLFDIDPGTGAVTNIRQVQGTVPQGLGFIPRYR